MLVALAIAIGTLVIAGAVFQPIRLRDVEAGGVSADDRRESETIVSYLQDVDGYIDLPEKVVVEGPQVTLWCRGWGGSDTWDTDVEVERALASLDLGPGWTLVYRHIVTGRVFNTRRLPFDETDPTPEIDE